ncbi:MAG: sigma-70 family RNA polymerase sigma factor [Planctomycetes bacterium]|nr:sigma-70 family RNA polymerase sigma factor [Planctomycetota bacterium]
MRDVTELVKRARGGDREALAALLEAVQDDIWRFQLSRHRSEADAEDATQETFVRMMSSLGELREPGAFRGWLYRIALNEALETGRRRRRLWRPLPPAFACGCSTGPAASRSRAPRSRWRGAADRRPAAGRRTRAANGPPMSRRAPGESRRRPRDSFRLAWTACSGRTGPRWTSGRTRGRRTRCRSTMNSGLRRLREWKPPATSACPPLDA